MKQLILKELGVFVLYLIAVLFIMPATLCLYVARGFNWVMQTMKVWRAEIDIYRAISYNVQRVAI